MNGIHLAYSLIKPTDKVLDIGGYYQPFRRANTVIDALPYQGRQVNNSFLQAVPEHFSEENWIIQDICDHTKKLPFADKEFDFVICGHVLEDIRDPIHITREMQRVAKRGYIEVPSRFHEQLRGVEQKDMFGNSHHRWFVDLRKNPKTGKNDLVFVFKNHLVHVDERYQIKRPATFLGRKPQLNPHYAVLSMIFDAPFEVYEDVPAAISNSHDFMIETVQLANELGPKLWDQSQGVPVSLSKNLTIGGITSLWEQEALISKRIHLYSPEGKRSKEIQEHEKVLTQNL